LRCGARPYLSALFLLVFGTAWLPAGDRVEAHHITAVRFWSLGDVTRIAIESDGEFAVRSDRLENPDRLFYDLAGVKPMLGGKGTTVIPVSDTLVRQIRVAETQHGVTRVVLDLERAADAATSHLDNPIRLIIEVRASPGTEARGASGVEARTSGALAPLASVAKPPIEAEVAESRAPVYRTFTPPAAPAAFERSERHPVSPVSPGSFDAPPVVRSQSGVPSLAANILPRLSPPSRPAPTAVLAKVSTPVTASPIPPAPALVATPAPETTALPAKHNSMGGRSMIRVLGLKVGRIVIDPGHGGHDTGTVGPEGLREKDLVLDISKRLGALIEERMNSEVIYTRTDDTFIALEQRTDIANQAKADLFLSIHANSSPLPSAAGVETYYLNFTTSKAALDLAARENAGSQKSIFELQDLLEKIALRDKVDESREFANRIQSALYSFSAKNDSHARDRGVRKAPFVVLIGASMPSVLAEIGFISNAHDEGVMKKAEYRQRLAESLYKGLSNYAGTLSHFQVAQKR
jgi:N-acetylmuramoyl-L-alanine amidase